MKCSKCGKEIINIQKASCISGYDEKGKHENWLCEKCSSEWDKEHPCYPIDYVKKSITDFVCKKCGSTEYEIKDKPNGTGIAHGLYCAKCGFWHKWLNKEELKQYGKKDSNGEIFSRLQAENAELTRKARQLTEENAELRARLERTVELPCKVGDKVYGVGFTDCEDSRTTDEKKKRQIFNVCMKMGGNCEKCKYRRPQIEEEVAKEFVDKLILELIALRSEEFDGKELAINGKTYKYLVMRAKEIAAEYGVEVEK